MQSPRHLTTYPAAESFLGLEYPVEGSCEECLVGFRCIAALAKPLWREEVYLAHSVWSSADTGEWALHVTCHNALGIRRQYG